MTVEKDFFTQANCDRCGKGLEARIMSWFTDETICMDCAEKEDEIKRQLKEAGRNPADFEGCGSIPKIGE